MQTQLHNEPVESHAETADASSSSENLPLSFAQERLWFFNEIAPGSPLYNIPAAIRLKGSLDRDALTKSFNALLARHESLRSNFISDSGVPSQVVRPNATIDLHFIHVSGKNIQQREKALRAILLSESRKPFDLASDLLIRASVFRIDPDDHVLFLNLHHIISDEWSMRVLFQELAIVYQDFRSGREPGLPELQVQYADFSLWQRDCLQGDLLNKEIAYWKSQLSELTPLNLATDRPRPTVQTYNGATLSRPLPSALATSLNHFSREHRTTLFITFLAAFKALLHRYTGQNDITVGSPISGRNKIELESLIGFFVNTLALRTRIPSNASFIELLAQVRETTLGAFAHQELPFEKLVEELHPERNASQLSILPVMFSLQDSSSHSFHIPGLQAEFMEIESRSAKFDLTISVRKTEHEMILLAEYNTDLFDSLTIERMLANYEQLLNAAIANPRETVSRLKLLTDSEKETLLLDWNKTETDFPKDKCVHELFELQAAKTPDAIAAVYGNRRLTYRELNNRADELANYLRKLGVGPDVLVGICVERSAEMLVGFLGILKAGGAYVPLDLDYPPERLAFMLQDSQSPVLLTQASLLQRFDWCENQILCLDSDWPRIAREKKVTIRKKPDAENLAYVIYTSGSTGEPKGVAVPHRAINRLVFNTNYIQLDSSDRIAQASNSSFDAATYEIWGALLHGGTLVGFTKDVVLSSVDFAEQLREHKITALFLTTALFNQIAADVPDAFKTVRTVLFGGEAVDTKSVRKILASGPPQRLLHVYGPTECTTFASWFEITDVPENATTIPIGKPLSNTQFYVLDANLQPVPVGVPGELYLGGDGLARGYFNRAELTAGRFLSNPFVPDSKLYKTGDLVRFLPDGNLEFVGRMDHQVKIRGFRIELPEIESVLRQHPDIKDALVLVHGENSAKQLVAYLVAPDGWKPDVPELRQFLKQKLPDYMVPSIFIPLERFPLNPNGKVDRPALPSPESSMRVEQPHCAARSPLEQQLIEIWEKVIGRKPIFVTDNFFDLGGHSLLAVRLFAQIEKEIGRKLPLALLFQSPTIEQLARTIEEDAPDAGDSCLIDIQPNGYRPPVFWLHTLGGGGGGGVLRYQKLSQLLGPEQPSYGLVAPSEPFTRIETMAAHYIKVMRTVQPAGPYHLGGYCFGGVVAFEMAQQLHAAGEEVGLLALLDSSPPNIVVHQNASVSRIGNLAAMPARMARFLRQKPDRMFASAARKLGKLSCNLLRAFGMNASPTIGPALEEVIDMSNYPKDYKRYAEVHWNALTHYTPKWYPGTVTLLETVNSTVRPSSIWKSLAADLDVRSIPTSHEKMLEEPHVQRVAAELADCLELNRNEELKTCAA